MRQQNKGPRTVGGGGLVMFITVANDTAEPITRMTKRAKSGLGI